MTSVDPLRELDTLPEIPDGVLLPYQKAWIADKSSLKVSRKSRRIGLTWAEGSDDALIAASSKEAGGQNVFYIGYNQDMAIEFIETCATWLKFFNYAASEVEEGIWEDDGDKEIKTYTIKCPDSGHRIVALSSRPNNLRGKQGVAVLDEAAFHDNLKELIKAAMAFLIWGGKVRIISTHDGEDNYFNTLGNEIINGERKGSVHHTTFKQAVKQGLYKRVCLRMGIEWTQQGEDEWVQGVYDFYGDDAREELDVIPSTGSGSYLPTFMIENIMYDAPVIRVNYDDAFNAMEESGRRKEVSDWIAVTLDPLLDKIDMTLEQAVGMDFARKGHLSVIMPATIQQNLVRKVPFILEIRNCPTRQQEQILWHIIAKLRPKLRAIAMDATGNGETLAEYTKDKFGEIVLEVKLNDAWYGVNMPNYKSGFEDKLLLIPRDLDTRKDHRKVAKIKGVPKLANDAEYDGQDGKKRHGDTAIAGCLMWFASIADPEMYDYEPVKQSSDNPSQFHTTTFGGGSRGIL